MSLICSMSYKPIWLSCTLILNLMIFDCRMGEINQKEKIDINDLPTMYFF